MFGIISSRPCDDVKVVPSAPACSAPCRAPAAPPSLCISMTLGTVPQMFFSPIDDQASDDSPMGDEGVIGIDGGHFADVVGHVRYGFVAIEGNFRLSTSCLQHMLASRARFAVYREHRALEWVRPRLRRK